ncbi:MAG TPA: phosphonate ABC transporter, permease protein PhnE [Rhodobacteraceae bacterium]|nr:phosphonate ABC transporter, permease protein PhnE [Paracoccaceae bacterium]
MPMSERNGQKVWQVRTTNAQLIRWAAWLVGLAVFLFSWKEISDNTLWFMMDNVGEVVADIGGRATPPAWSYITELGKPIWDTLAIATLGTIFALIMAVPVAFLAARNTTPSRIFVRPIALLVIVSTRSVNSLIWALLLVSIVGPGVLAGLIAISIRSIGFCAKLLYEAIEEINVVQVEAIKATGASPMQVMVYGIVPQIMPAFAGIAVFRWDINIRESTVLGLVGAGGIGLALQSSLNVLAWPKVSLILLVILVAVVIGEWVSAKVRGAII